MSTCDRPHDTIVSCSPQQASAALQSDPHVVDFHVVSMQTPSVGQNALGIWTHIYPFKGLSKKNGQTALELLP